MNTVFASNGCLSMDKKKISPGIGHVNTQYCHTEWKKGSEAFGRGWKFLFLFPITHLDTYKDLVNKNCLRGQRGGEMS